jgi:predicted Rossmann fold flavoprotein
LVNAAKKLGVEILPGASVSGVDKNPKGGFNLTVREARADFHLQTKKLLFATGGDSKSREMIQALGHNIIEPVPSLFTFNVKDKRIADLAGVSVENVTLKMEAVTTQGALLITHWGMSGPAVLKCSAWGARILAGKNYRAKLTVNWLGDFSFDKTLEILTRNKEWKDNARKKAATNPAFSQIPLRLWKQLTGFIGEKNWADVSKAELRQLAQELSAGEFVITGKGQFKDEFVTCGGVSLKDVDFKTMQSRITDNLFFAGEVLDIDGLTGGFNFQAAWTTGWIAGSGLSPTDTSG